MKSPPPFSLVLSRPFLFFLLLFEALSGSFTPSCLVCVLKPQSIKHLNLTLHKERLLSPTEIISPPEVQADECEIQRTVDLNSQEDDNPNVIFNRPSNAFVTSWMMFYLADGKSNFQALNKQSAEQVARFGASVKDLPRSKNLQRGGTKAKINTWDYIKLKSFCSAKEAIREMKKQLTEWKKMPTNRRSDKELACQIYKELIQLGIKKKKNSWADELIRLFPKKTSERLPRE